MSKTRSSLSTAQTYTSSSSVRIIHGELTSQATTGLLCRDTPLVVRRGCPLILQLSLSVSLSSHYTITASFLPIPGPHERSSTFRVNGVGKGVQEIWLSIDLPSYFPVGRYDVLVTMTLRGCPEILSHTLHSAVAVLFNPWNPDDEVYIDSEGINTYIIPEIGVLWRGTQTTPSSLIWNYGQYQPNILDVALLLLKELSAEERRTAVHVARAIFSQIAPSDNTGVLSVSYTGCYGGGVHPCKWNSSISIIQKYYRTKMPVKFGQCWISAGVGISLLRALGIPCRPVTCYNAAVQTEQLGRVNCYFTPEGDIKGDLENDHIWAYHIWCECWMRRDDLPVGYDGWQVVDSVSSGPTHSLGPVPVKAIYEENPSRIWDNDVKCFLSMIHSEVRYHRVTHTYSTITNQQSTLALIQSDQTGIKLYTSSKNMSDWLDITASYRKDRPMTMLLPKSPYPYPPPSRDCHVEVTCSHVTIGNDFNVTVTIGNKGPMLRTVDGKVIGMSTQYTGKIFKSFLSMQFEGSVTPQQTATVNLPISSRQYLRHLQEQNILKFFIVAKIRETKQLFFIGCYHQLQQLPMLIKSPQTVKVGEVVRVTLSFRNSLSFSLSHIVFLLQVQTLCNHKEVAYRHVLLPGRVAQVEIIFPAINAGHYILLASMSCDQLTDVHSSTELTVLS